MKKIFTLSATLLLSFSLFAFPFKSVLTVSNISNYPVKIKIDNSNYNDNNNSKDIVVRDINAGYHNIKVYRENSNWNGRKNQVLFSGNIYVKPGFHTDIIINRFGKAFIDEQQITQGWYDNQDDDNCDNMQPMQLSDFNQLKQTINNAGFDNAKLSIAKQTMSNNYFTAAQVKELVDLFSFENSKLDMAKSAYRATSDKGNYFMVSNALKYNSSKEELAKFLQTSR